MNNLRDFRCKKLLTQRKLAELSGISQATISHIENELSESTEATKNKLAKALKLPLDKVFPRKPIPRLHASRSLNDSEPESGLD